MAFMSLRSNKMRSFLTMLGIIIGVLAITLLISTVQGATGQITGQIESLGSNLLIVSITSPRETYLTVDGLKALEGTGGIGGVAPVVSHSQTVRAGTQTVFCPVTGVTPDYAAVRSLNLRSGRFLCDVDAEARAANAVIGSETAKELYGTDNCIGNALNILGRSFTVVGLLEETEHAMLGASDNIVITHHHRPASHAGQGDHGRIHHGAILRDGGSGSDRRRRFFTRELATRIPSA
jgi:putative ABC transport system permease protein